VHVDGTLCGIRGILVYRVLTRMIREIRDLQRQQVELAQQALANQSTVLANQKDVMERQVRAREILVKSLRWTQIVLGLLVLAVFIHFLQPLLIFSLMRPH
jgi:hypothetical protein